jgi:hypothetical protein
MPVSESGFGRLDSALRDNGFKRDPRGRALGAIGLDDAVNGASNAVDQGFCKHNSCRVVRWGKRDFHRLFAVAVDITRLSYLLMQQHLAIAS